MPSAYKDVPWIEIEAKQKERAIAKLRQEWLVNRDWQGYSNMTQ
jgi:UV DNA damage repair endonuclease